MICPFVFPSSLSYFPDTLSSRPMAGIADMPQLLPVGLCTARPHRCMQPHLTKYHFFILHISVRPVVIGLYELLGTCENHKLMDSLSEKCNPIPSPPPKQNILNKIYFSTVEISFTEYKNNLYWETPFTSQCQVNMQIKQKLNLNCLQTEFQWEGFCLVWIRCHVM